ncbi:adenosine deaminase [Streptomyces lavendulae]|uniref:Aminodeoxyfutalosine deaminase n=1 Tax=Streptomyces lavendulae subsp. lavendulae TaxID=58340 RepID=A0A2K8PHF7_STRLA|nr:adenosine deaminase [Streptomyces lavendulae]GLX39097.1 putative adenosine/adenine deaminase [Streptomyces roseochromogenus]ATZ25065.1 Aminodeoxyfutalosine deaminase [Streptomyces lavendulae subsp. lavendulae]QUQ54895.1 Aminodeoxyfutalosine deaminase [Streptomyces lavendulae subsp. lavendulae]GLV80344.1 putative adenosine/adenine deaminase [Streptomyces lavendulae subsp. lavendulae]GLW00025.1 putative adenosine/adenine deaminase [Streptomyces lavendulae subsp. lavendulae]
MEHVRDLTLLPKAHLHLHFTGSMRPSTLLELADKYGVRLPDALTAGEPPKLRATDERGWFRFQRLYDAARSCLREPDDIRRLVREAAEEDVRDGSGWLEIQVDPTSYAPLLGGMIPAVEIILDAVDAASRETGLGMRVLIAANRMKHPLDARTLARLAVRYADRGIVGFGLSNDERRGMARDFDRAFAIAREGGLLAAPHGGELTGPASVRDCLDDLHAARIGHGVRAAEDPRLLKRLADRQITCEVCPASNVALGVYERPEDVPLRTLFEAGVPMALGADDPLLFGSRLAAQYEIARRHHAFTDAELAELARQSVRGSAAPDEVKAKLLDGIDHWLNG